MLIKKINFFVSIFFLVIIFFYTNIQNATEVIIFADSINYDNKKNVIAKGNAKIIKNNEIITSDLIIYNKEQKKIILPKNFNFKDKKNNYYNGSSGIFTSDFKFADIEDIKILLNDGSRIVGTSGSRNEHIDIITKGVYTPCTSRIKIGNFICPIWQLEGEKILHDNKKNGVFNIGSGKKTNLIKIIKLVQKYNSVKKNILIDDKKLDRNLIANISKIKKMNFRPKFSINKIIMDFYKKKYQSK